MTAQLNKTILQSKVCNDHEKNLLLQDV